MNEFEVHVQLPGGEEVLAGNLSSVKITPHGATTAQFRYTQEYLATELSYNLSPELRLDTTAQETPLHRDMFMAFEDAGPDRWGRDLIQAQADEEARSKGHRIAKVGALERLSLVPDNTRQGALRIRDAHGWSGTDASPEEADLVDWSELTQAAADVQAGRALEGEIAKLFRYGSTSPGGARPKTHAFLNGRLMLAKMPHKSDKWDVSRWEAATLFMLERAGIDVPHHSLHNFGENKSILLLDRFDRRPDGTRIGYISARTLLHIEDHDIDRGSYEALANALRLAGGRRSLHQLFSRIAVTALVNNTDDHMRNFGLLRTRTGWEISPTFDVNPEPFPSDTSTPIFRGGDRGYRDLRELLESRDLFDLTKEEAKAAILKAEQATSDWMNIGLELGENPADIGFFSRMFEGPNREWAKSLTSDTEVPLSAPSQRPSKSARRKDLGLGKTSGGGNSGSFASRKRPTSLQ